MKFSLRDFFWLLLVVAILCVWWSDHRDLGRYQRAVKRLRTLGFDLQAMIDHVHKVGTDHKVGTVKP